MPDYASVRRAYAKDFLPRFAVGLSATALALSVTGLSAADAVTAVKRALSAKNADAVDGISASRAPRAGHLLPLGSDGRFPAAVLPAGARGLRGPQGPQGPAGAQGIIGPSGPAGATRVFIDREDRNLYPGLDVPVKMAELRLPAGAYLVTFSSRFWAPAGGFTPVDCGLRRNGVLDPGPGPGTVWVGNTPETVGEDTLAFTEAVVVTGAEETVRVDCSKRENIAVEAIAPRLTAVQVQQVIEK